MFMPASAVASFPVFLTALFVLATAQETQRIFVTYLGLALALLAAAGLVWQRRNRLAHRPPEIGGWKQGFDLLQQPRFAFGAACIFLYVGAEVAIDSIIVSYLMQPEVMGLARRAAGDHVSFYWGGAMLGRFAGSYVLRLFAPGKVLARVATAVIGLLGVSAFSTGAVSGWSLLAIGLCNSIMFPTIFSLAREGLAARAAEGSGIIATAIVRLSHSCSAARRI